MRTATFGGGCFWCTEAVFARVRGVTKIVPGYMGGHVENPTYEQVCTKTTGHVEVIQITFDPDLVDFAVLLEIFFRTHDPTTRDRQGNDVGPQYRSAVFFHDDEQKAAAEEAIERLDESGAFDGPIVTEVVPAVTFYPAESYHHDYFARNPQNPYCNFVIGPKLQKLESAFADALGDQ